MTNNRNPGRHTKQSFSDEEAVSSLCAWIARSHRAMPDIKANDKWPNIDGYVELTDLGGFPSGTLKTQVKKLSKTDANAKRFTFTTKDSRTKFLTYCEESRELPIILIGVDLERQCAYWRHLDKQYLNSLRDNEIITFPVDNIISLERAKYIEEWLKLVKASNQKARIAEAFNAEELERITRSGTRILGKEDDNFRAIHLFLDQLNGLLDGDFRVVKEVFYLSAWKVGFAYYSYGADSVGYMLYPIPLATNDTLIKEVDQTLFQEFRQKGLGFSDHSSNPIANNPTGEVERIIRQRLNVMLEKRLFKHAGSEALATEYILGFIERYPTQLNLPPDKDNYTLAEVEEGFNTFLPFWLEEASRFLQSSNRNNFNERLRTGRIQYYDLEWWHEIIGGENQIIRDKALERITNHEEPPTLPIDARGLSPRIFAESLNYLKESGATALERLYAPRNTTNVGTVFEYFTAEEVHNNLEVFFDNFPRAYETFTANNFPGLKDELSFMGQANKLLFVYDLMTNPMHPVYTMYFLQDESDDPNATTEVITRQQFGRPDPWRSETLQYEGHGYTIINAPGGGLNFVYSLTPMMDLIYNTLGHKLPSIDITA